MRGDGILTICPSSPPFGIPLGPTNPWLINMAKETSEFRRAWISHALRLLAPAFSLPYAPPWVTPLASQRTERSPTTPCVSRYTRYFRIRDSYTGFGRSHVASPRAPRIRNPYTSPEYHMQCDTHDIRSFGTMLSPDHLRRRISGSVSCYAIFKGWLLLSQPPDCHRNPTSLVCY